MTEGMIDLARRAVACKGWRWMPGMMRLRVTQPQMSDYLRREGRVPDGHDEWAYDDWPVIPDLSDPATMGCLLTLVREAWRCAVILTPDYEYDDEARQGQHPTGWRAVETARWVTVGDGGTEAEALVATLEAAP